MKVELKLAWKNIRASRRRIAPTVTAVSLASALITFVSVIYFQVSEPIKKGIAYYSEINPSQSNSFEWLLFMFRLLLLVTAAVACMMIYASFKSAFDGRVRIMGILTSVGMSARQKTLTVLFESLLYGVGGVLIGLPIGALCARAGYTSVFDGSTEFAIPFADEFPFRIRAAGLLFGAAVSIAATAAASLSPVRRLRKISVLDSMRGRMKVNISLRRSVVSELTERVFGRLGKLAGQNYENYKENYRALALCLSGGTAVFVALYCAPMYKMWMYERDHGEPMPPQPELAILLGFAAVYVVLTAISAAGGTVVSMDARAHELAMLKSIGLGNAELCRMMCIESVYLAVYSAFYGLIGSLVADRIVWYWIMVTDPMAMTDMILPFMFPVTVFLCLFLFDMLVGVIFAFYAALRVRRINIVESIKSRI